MSALAQGRSMGSLPAIALAASLSLLVPGCTLPEAEVDPTIGRSGAAAGAPVAGDSARVHDPLSQHPEDAALLRKRNATIRTGYDTYIVRDVRFNTAEGFAGDRVLMGHYNGTVWQFELRFVQSIDFEGKIDASEALSAPDNYFVREETDLRKTFRTRLTKTDGETLDFVVRINSIRGELERGGPLQISIDEMETLRRIDFF